MIVGRLLIGIFTLVFAIGGAFVGLALRRYLDWPVVACILVGVMSLYLGNLIDRSDE